MSFNPDQERDEHGRWVAGGAHEMPRTIDAPHGTVVARSKYGSIEAVRSGDTTRYLGRRTNGENVGTFGTTHAAADALRAPLNPNAYRSGYRRPDVTWKWGRR